jgi:hypothetical protein
LQLIVLTLVVLAATAQRARGEEFESTKGSIGLGFVLGEPSGVSVKWQLDAARTIALEGRFVVGAIDRGVGGQLGVIWSPLTLAYGCVTNERFAVPLYVGGGARMLNHQRTSTSTRDRHLGGYAVVGIALDFAELPVELFAEVGAVVDHVDVDDDHGGFPLPGAIAGIGLRFFP